MRFRNRSLRPRLALSVLCGLLLATTGLPLTRILEAQASYMEGFSLSMHNSMAQMHRQMDGVRMTGSPDRDFAAMMIPHHRGALEMAKAELLYGQDPVLRRLAQEILVDQKSEIDVMTLWLERHPVTPRPSRAK